MYLDDSSLMNILEEVAECRLHAGEILLVDLGLELDNRKVLVAQGVETCDENFMAKGRVEGWLLQGETEGQVRGTDQSRSWPSTCMESSRWRVALCKWVEKRRRIAASPSLVRMK